MKLPILPKWEWVLIGTILFLGTFLRFYHLPQTLLFLGDQGRDALIAKQILRDGDVALIGPVTSVGNMYLGPFYYYFMVPFLALTYPDPVGPALGVAFINTLSILALYLVTRRFFRSRVAIVATILYALMPLAIQFSRFSWNPNLGSPAAILVFWFLVRWLETRQWRFAVGLGISLGIIIQLHYVTLITWGVVALFWIILMVKSRAKRGLILAQGVIIALLAFALLSPLVVFDFRHDHIISAKFGEFFTSRDAYMQPWARLSMIVKETEGRMYQVLSQLVSGSKQPITDRLIGYGSIATLSLLLFSRRGKKESAMYRKATLVTIVWLLLTVIGIAFYSSSIFNHYLTFCIPIVAIYWAILIDKSWNHGLFGKLVSGAIGVGLLIACVVGIRGIPYQGVGTSRIEQTVNQTIPLLVQPYNLALIAENGDFQGMNYRYFFNVSAKPPQASDDYLHLAQLVVIDEVKNDNPLSVAAFEIQAPHLTRLETSFFVNDGPRVYMYR